MRFNPPATPAIRTTNLAGGTAYAQGTEHELASLVLTSFLADKFYRQGSDELARLRALVAADPHYAAQAATYARLEHGMRSVSHAIAGEVVEHAKGEAWVKDFIRAVVRRPDDMTEIVAYRAEMYGLHPLPNSLKKGLAAAFGKFDGYQLGKYRATDKTVKLVDVVNLVKPKPNDRNREALAALVGGTLRQEDTWEDRLSSGEDKATVWRDLITADKLGYFALLRNLRNIALQADDETFSLAVTQLVDPERIAKSLVLPFRYLTAYKELSSIGTVAWAFTKPKGGDIPSARRTTLLQALSVAASHAVANIPDLPGRTLISLDSSGSMTTGRVGGPRSQVTAGEIGALFAAALVRRLGGRAGLILFDTDAHQLPVNPSDSVLTIAGHIQQHMRGGGTNLDLAFATGERYDRVIILSDMQAWVNGEWRSGGGGWWGHTPSPYVFAGYHTPPVHRPAAGALSEYEQRTGAKPQVYGFDLTGYGSIQFPAERCYQLAGWSDKVFTLLGLLGEDRHAMINTIKRISFE